MKEFFIRARTAFINMTEGILWQKKEDKRAMQAAGR
jgi:hypothetical protein